MRQGGDGGLPLDRGERLGLVGASLPDRQRVGLGAHVPRESRGRNLVDRPGVLAASLPETMCWRLTREWMFLSLPTAQSWTTSVHSVG
jgi:hypothetical protein